LLGGPTRKRRKKGTEMEQGHRRGVESNAPRKLKNLLREEINSQILGGERSREEEPFERAPHTEDEIFKLSKTKILEPWIHNRKGGVERGGWWMGGMEGNEYLPMALGRSNLMT